MLAYAGPQFDARMHAAGLMVLAEPRAAIAAALPRVVSAITAHIREHHEALMWHAAGLQQLQGVLIGVWCGRLRFLLLGLHLSVVCWF